MQRRSTRPTTCRRMARSESLESRRLLAVISMDLGQTLRPASASVTYSLPARSTAAIDLAPLALPSPWSAADIGAPALPGSTSYASGSWTLQGAGADIWGTADQFQFASQSFAGNGSIIARVDSLTNTNVWAKAGVMFRDSSAAGAAFADVVVTPGSGVSFQWRSSAGGTCNSATVTGQTTPKWVKLTRVGDDFTAYYSANGTTWTQIGSSQRVYMDYAAMAGLAVTSHNTTQLAAATFSNVSFSTAATTVTVDVGQVIKTVNNNALGINVSWWDTALNTAQTRNLVTAAGLGSFRFPGGSSSDEFHFAKPPEWGGKGTAATFAQFIESVGGGGMVTLNYGTGSPQEAAAFLAYLNAPTNSTVSLGWGQQWVPDSSTSITPGTWVQKDWKTAGYWASLRGAAKLATDDGLNFLRISHPAPFGFRYFEVGNEVHGSWETDMHGSGGDTGKPHDAATYISFSKQVASYAQQIDPAAVVSIVIDGSNGWTTSVLQQCVSQAYTPKAVSDHTYMQGPGGESDAFLLMGTSADPSSGFYWPTKATNIRNLLTTQLGSTVGNAVEMLETEFNSVYAGPGKQSTSLVNGLFLADSIGTLLKSGYNGGWMWDLRNGWDTANNNSPSLYGWRMGGDYGILGSGNTAPASGTYIPYPTYFSEQLLSKMAHNGDAVVTASSNDPFLSTYAIRQANGHLSLLVINKASSNSITGTFSLGGFTPNGQVQFWQYGKTEDTAQSQTTDGHSSLSIWTSTLALNGSSFSYSFPAYSMTVMDLGQAALPAGWSSNDIGSVGLPGYANYSNGTWTLQGAGADIWNSADAFRYASKTISANGEIIARVSSVANTDTWAKAGVMFRGSTSADAPFAAVVQLPSNEVMFEYRTATGVAAQGSASVGGTASPKWVRMVRSGDSYSAYYATTTGTPTSGDWVQIGSAVSISMPTVIRAGLAVTSHSTAAVCTATFTNVSVNDSVPTVQSFTINGGATQRSIVKQLGVTFSEPVTLATGAIALRLQDGSAVPNTTLTLSNASGDQMTYVVTFSGSAVIGGSLADGIYDLIATAAQVQDLTGNAMTADYTQRFHRLFGDSDGNRIINSLDYARLKQTFGRAPSDPLFNSAFDYEGNNLINALDLARFRQRYGMSFSY